MINKLKISHPLLERIESGETLISDGGIGTYLQSHGLEAGGDPEEFNITNPETVKLMAKEYYDAGSDIVLTNTFGGTIFRQKHYGLDHKVHDLNEQAALIAKSQTPEGKFVLGSVGPTGQFLEPYGDTSEKDMYEGFKQQILALEAGGVDGIILETMTALEEASIAIKAALENTNLLIAATMTFDKGPRGFFTMMGITPEDAAIELSNAGAHIVGSNCGNGIDNMIEIAQKMRDSTDRPLIIHSNAGIPSMKSGNIIYPETPEYMAERFMKLKDIGINIIGGCCGTSPTHIKAIHESLKRDQ
ncbi:MAG: methionine synthase [SAR202 cluster bacterium]|nr:methionine synthase [Chloroflexota bacterium]MQG22550.1 methionine synthase [SAR202 cluster bacterium]|tara:strand:+ start:10075 stop:10980 length:906 start_codon:yes stop_codon:yes gene_type:complete